MTIMEIEEVEKAAGKLVDSEEKQLAFLSGYPGLMETIGNFGTILERMVEDDRAEDLLLLHAIVHGQILKRSRQLKDKKSRQETMGNSLN